MVSSGRVIERDTGTGGSPGDTVKRPVWRHRSTGSEDDDRPVDGGGSRSAPATSENSPLAPPRLLRQVSSFTKWTSFCVIGMLT